MKSVGVAKDAGLSDPCNMQRCCRGFSHACKRSAVGRGTDGVGKVLAMSSSRGCNGLELKFIQGM